MPKYSFTALLTASKRPFPVVSITLCSPPCSMVTSAVMDRPPGSWKGVRIRCDPYQQPVRQGRHCLYPETEFWHGPACADAGGSGVLMRAGKSGKNQVSRVGGALVYTHTCKRLIFFPGGSGVSDEGRLRPAAQGTGSSGHISDF